MRFDSATISKDADTLLELISEAENLIQTENTPSQARLYYSIATAYSDLSSLKRVSKEDAIKKQLYFFRKSIDLLEAEDCCKEEYKPYILGLTSVLRTNYANMLDYCGRRIAAIEQYKKVLKINPDFGMALGNLGRVYLMYGDLEYEDWRRDYFYYYAYSLLSKASASNDPDTHDDAKTCFKNSIRDFNTDYIEHLIDVIPNIADTFYSNPDEQLYRNWALEKGLFLNPLNDLPELKQRFAVDSIQLPKMIVAVDAKGIFHGMFNQIKQEYIYARYLYYSSLETPEEPHFADQHTYLLNFPDFPQYSIRIEQLKSAYKILYGLLDRIAYFINAYYKLGINERSVSFSTVWKSNQLDPNCNFALSSLYWIGKDFSERFEDSPNPHLKRLKDIRHAMEHKYTKVVWTLFSDRTTGEFDGLALYITESELYSVTLQLLHIIREAIICLALSVNIEEYERRKKIDPNAKIFPMEFMSYDDQWKV